MKKRQATVDCFIYRLACLLIASPLSRCVINSNPLLKNSEHLVMRCALCDDDVVDHVVPTLLPFAVFSVLIYR